MIIKGNIEDILHEHVLVATTDPWPEYIPRMSDDELIYTALVRCSCGSGMAYPKVRPVQWGCSAILAGRAVPGPEHSELYPFYMWKFKSENADVTTRQGEKP